VTTGSRIFFLRVRYVLGVIIDLVYACVREVNKNVTKK